MTTKNTLTLPKQKIKVTDTNPSVLTLYGPPKVGKTTVLSQLENNLIIDTELGSKFVEALKIQPSNLDEFNEICRMIMSEDKPYKYVTIDTVDRLEEWIELYATEQYMNSSIGKEFNRYTIEDFKLNKAHKPGVTKPKKDWESVLTLPHGAGYLWLRDAFKKYFNLIRRLAPHIIFVGHMRDKVLNKDGKEVSVADLNLTGKVRDILAFNSDAMGYMYRAMSGDLMISFKTSEVLQCGNRIDRLAGKEFKFNWEEIYV